MAEISNDHDLLIRIDSRLNDLQGDVRGVSDQVRDIRSALDATIERQRDTDNRLTNVTSTVVRVQADQRDITTDIAKLREAHDKRISTIDSDLIRWKLYLRVAVILTTPVYLGMLALAIEAAKRYLFP